MSSEQAKGPPWFIALASAVRECQLAATHGPHVSMLVLMVANIQVQTRRQGLLVPIFTAQLMPLIGVRQEDTLRSIRQKAIDAGWLTYQSGGTRAAGKYAAHIPQDYPGEIGSMAYVVPREMPSEIPPGFRPSPLPSPDNTSPKGAEVITSSEKITRKARQPPSYTTEDAELAKWMWGLIHTMQPTRKPPNLDQWANDFRLMRESDKRETAEIRQVFEWVNAHDFWRKNILSPDKLRSKWDDLTLQLQEARKGPQKAATTQQPQATPINTQNKRDI